MVDTARELLKGNTPTLVLAVLKDSPRHGYGIAREIERRSGNALQFKEGTLYPALHALEREGLITGEWQKESGGRERKVYTITPAGLAALDRRTRTWSEFAAAIHQVIQGEPAPGGPAPIGRSRPRRPVRPTPEPGSAG
jgi:PadR family transcriptional regulator PadR